MSVNKVIAAATLPVMIASPALAATENPAASLSLRGDSGEAAVSRDSSATEAPVPAPAVAAATAGGISTGLLIGGALVVAIIIGAVALGSGHHNNHPASA